MQSLLKSNYSFDAGTNNLYKYLNYRRLKMHQSLRSLSKSEFKPLFFSKHFNSANDSSMQQILIVTELLRFNVT